jgi:chromosome segregation ATPase
MNKDGKVFLIFLSITTVILLYSTIILFVIKESEKDKKMVLQKRLDEITVLKQDLESKVREIELANAEMKASLKIQEEKANMLSQRLDDEKSASGKYASQVQQREIEIQSLKSRLSEEKSEKDSLLGRIEKMNEEYLRLKFQLENMLKTKEEMDKRASELAEKEGVSLGTIVINQSR